MAAMIELSDADKATLAALLKQTIAAGPFPMLPLREILTKPET